MPGGKKVNATWEWREWGSFSGSNQISSKLKGTRPRDRNADTEAFAALRGHLKESRSRLEEIRDASSHFLESHRHGNLAGWAHFIETMGEKQGGRLGSLLQQLGKMQRQLEMQRTAVLVSTQEKLQKSLKQLLEEDYRIARDQKLQLYQARGELEEAAERVKHYRRKIKDGKGGQEVKMQGAIEELLHAKHQFSTRNVNVSRDLTELPLRTGLALAQGLAASLAAESLMCEETSRLLRSLAEPLNAFLREAMGETDIPPTESPASTSDLLTSPSDCTPRDLMTPCKAPSAEEEVKEVGAALHRLAELTVPADSEGRLPLHQIQALAEGSRLGSLLGAAGGVEGGRWRLRAQRPVPGIKDDDEEGSPAASQRRPGDRQDGVFGLPLEAVPARRRGLGAQQIIDIPDDLAQAPWVVQELCALLEARGAGCADLFKRAGDARRVSHVRSELDQGRGELQQLSDPHDLAALLKLFLKLLPEPLIPSTSHRALVHTAAALPSLAPAEQAGKIEGFLSSLPQRPAATLHRLVTMLRRLALDRSNGRMDAATMAIALAPCVSRPSSAAVSVDALMHHASAAAILLRALIERGGGPPVAPLPVQPPQQSKTAHAPQPLSPTASSTHSTVSSHSHSHSLSHSVRSAASVPQSQTLSRHPSASGSLPEHAADSRCHSRHPSLDNYPALPPSQSSMDVLPDSVLPATAEEAAVHDESPAATSVSSSASLSTIARHSGQFAANAAFSGSTTDGFGMDCTWSPPAGVWMEARSSSGGWESRGIYEEGRTADADARGGSGRERRPKSTNPFESPDMSADDDEDPERSGEGMRESSPAWSAGAHGEAAASTFRGQQRWEHFDSGMGWESPAGAVAPADFQPTPRSESPQHAAPLLQPRLSPAHPHAVGLAGSPPQAHAQVAPLARPGPTPHGGADAGQSASPQMLSPQGPSAHASFTPPSPARWNAATGAEGDGEGAEQSRADALGGERQREAAASQSPPTVPRGYAMHGSVGRDSWAPLSPPATTVASGIPAGRAGDSSRSASVTSSPGGIERPFVGGGAEPVPLGFEGKGDPVSPHHGLRHVASDPAHTSRVSFG